jgi:staphylococcal nuclease domain-containing protein 1
LFKDYDEEAEKAATAPEVADDTGALESSYIDIIISDVRPGNDLTFSVQVLNTEGELSVITSDEAAYATFRY